MRGIVLMSLCAPLAAGCGAEQRPVDGGRSCSPAYPSGILPGTSKRLTLSFTVGASYPLEDQRYAQAQLPGYFTDLLNAAAAGSDTTFAVADGVTANLGVDVGAYQDQTQSHYGVVIRVSGPEDLGGVGRAASVPLFYEQLPALYVSEDALFQDAAARFVAYVGGGWTCAENGSMSDCGGSCDLR